MFECVEFLFRRLMGFNPQYPLEQIHQRKQRRVLIVLCIPTFPPYIWFVCHVIFEHLDQAAFANACLTREYDHLTLPSFHLLPALNEQSDFLLPTNQRCQSPGHRHVETPPSATFLEDAVHLDGLSHTSQRLCSQILPREIALNQT